jgi:hypothetical protein
MANDVSGQPGEAATPSDETFNQNAPATTPETGTEAAPQEQSGKADLSQYVTRDEVGKLVQSWVDRTGNRLEAGIQKQIKDEVSALRRSQKVLGLTDEQVETAKQKIVYDAFTSESEAPAGNSQTPSQVQDQEPPVVGWARAQMEQAGVQIVDGDPELAVIEPAMKSGDQYAFAAALKSAIEAKKARLASQTEGAKRRTAPPSGGTASKKPLSAEEKMSKGLQGSWGTEPPPK